MNEKFADVEFGREGEIRTRKLLEKVFGPLEDQNETNKSSGRNRHFAQFTVLRGMFGGAMARCSSVW